MSKKIVLVTVGVLALFVVAIFVSKPNISEQKTVSVAKEIKQSVQIFKSPTCGCCKGYASALGQDGFQVKATDMSDVGVVKDKYNIPAQMRSCHTTVVGKYFVEGHVPIEAVNKLLREQPDIDGIALPGMPIGTPGMPGRKQGPFVIYQVTDGVYSEYMTM